MKNPLKREEPRKTESGAMALRKGWISRVQSNQHQNSLFSRLQILLSEHVIEMNNWKLRCHRLANVRALVEQDSMRCITGEPTELARLVIAGEDISTVILETRKPLASFYNKLKFKDEPEDIEALKAFDFERATVMVLEAAVKLQKKMMVEARIKYMAEYSQAAIETRSLLVRKFLTALAEAQQAVEQDRHLMEELDPEEAALLSPPPFPIRILSEQAVKFLIIAVSQNIIGEEELRNVRIN